METFDKDAYPDVLEEQRKCRRRGEQGDRGIIADRSSASAETQKSQREQPFWRAPSHTAYEHDGKAGKECNKILQRKERTWENTYLASAFDDRNDETIARSSNEDQ